MSVDSRNLRWWWGDIEERAKEAWKTRSAWNLWVSIEATSSAVYDLDPAWSRRTLLYCMNIFLWAKNLALVAGHSFDVLWHLPTESGMYMFDVFEYGSIVVLRDMQFLWIAHKNSSKAEVILWMRDWKMHGDFGYVLAVSRRRGRSDDV